MAKSARVKALALAVSQAFQNAGFTPQTLLQGQIAMTDLPWQAPPLKADAKLGGLPFSSYVDYALPVNEAAFYDWYCDTVYQLHSDPGKAYGCPVRVINANAGERALRLPVPDGWPSSMDLLAGHLFAMECAHVARHSLVCTSVVEDESNYYAETASGIIGLQAGFPSVYGDLWDTDASGLVPELLTRPRGQVTTLCLYDVVAKVRSALYENMDRFAEFEGLDLALRALRIMTADRQCTELLQAIDGIPMAAFMRKRKLQIVLECLEVMESWRLTDREKLGQLYEKLVPEVMKLADYQKKIFDPWRRMPAVMHKSTENKIMNQLRWLKEKFSDTQV